MRRYNNGITTFVIIIVSLIFIKNMQAPVNSYIASKGMVILIWLGIVVFLFEIMQCGKIPIILFAPVLYAVCGIVSTAINIFNSKNDISILRAVIMTIFWVVIFIISYIDTEKSKISTKPFYIMAYTFPIIAYSFYRIYQVQFIERSTLINSVYYLVIFIPVFLSINRFSFKTVGMLTIFFGVLVSLKRTALIAAATSIFVYFCICLFSRSEHNRLKSRMKYILSFFIVVGGIAFAGVFLIDSYNINWLLRMQSLESDGGSGRDFIWKTTVVMQTKSNLFEWLLGHGYNAVARDTLFNLSAHNDFLEVLYDFGLVTLVFYLWFVLLLVKNCIQMCKYHFYLAPPFAASLVIFFVMSTTSHLVIYPTYFFFLNIFWAISIAQYEKYKTNIIMRTDINNENKHYDLSPRL